MKSAYAILALSLVGCSTVQVAQPKPRTPEEAAAAAKDDGESSMRMGNLTVKDSTGTTRTVAATNVAGVETSHHIVSDPDGAQLQDIVTSDGAMPGGVKGPVILGQRRDADTTIADTDGDAAPLQLDATGALKVTGGGGGTQVVTDTASTGADTGNLTQTVRQDTLASSTTTTGDFQPLKSDQYGSTYVQPTFDKEGTPTVVSDVEPLPISGTVSTTLGTEIIDDSNFTEFIDTVMPGGAWYNDIAPDAPDENDIGAFRMSSNRVLYQQIRDAAGNERGANVNSSNELLTANSVLSSAGNADDAAFGIATDMVLSLGAVFDDVSPDTVNEGDAMALRGSSRRELYVQLRDAAGNERGVNVTATNELKVDDDSTQSQLVSLNTAVGLTQKLISSTYADGYGSYPVYVKQATPTALSGVADTENSPAAVDLSQRLYVANSSSPTTVFSTIDTSASSNSSTIDVRQCASVWIEFEWVSGSATATGSLEFYGSTSSSIAVDDDNMMHLGVGGDPDESFINTVRCTVPASPNNDQADYSVASGSAPSHCAMRIPDPLPYLIVRHVAGTGGSAGDLTAILSCRQF